MENKKLKSVNTKIREAEDSIKDIMSAESNIFSKWGTIDYSTSSIKLNTSKMDFAKYLRSQMFIRPGFKASNKSLRLSQIFVKIDGFFDFKEEIIDFKEREKAGNYKVLNNIRQLCREPNTDFFSKKPKWINDEGTINVELAAKSSLRTLNYLKPAYKKNYLNAINNLMKQVINGNALYEKASKRLMIELFIYNSKLIVEMYHKFDYPFMPPLFIVNDKTKKIVNIYGALRLLLMKNLGFDIVIISEQKFCNIENVIKENQYDLHIFSSKSKQKLKNISRFFKKLFRR